MTQYVNRIDINLNDTETRLVFSDARSPGDKTDVASLVCTTASAVAFAEAILRVHKEHLAKRAAETKQ